MHQRSAKGRTDSNTDGDPNCDVVECNAKSHTDSRADGNAHADGRLTFLAIGQVGPPIQSSTHHNTADVDADPTAGRLEVQCGSRGCAAFHARARR